MIQAFKTRIAEIKNDPRITAMKHDQSGRAKRYDNIDGTGEMFMGLMMLAFALLGYLQTILPEHSIWRTNMFASMAFMYLILGAVLALGFLGQKFIKRNFTWPRTGYVALGVAGTGGTGKPATAQDVKAKRLLRVGMLIIFIELVVIAGLIGAGVVWFSAYVKRHPDVLDLAMVGYVGYLALWLPLYAFWVWRMGRGHAWKWLVLLLMALGLAVIGITGPGNTIGVSRTVMVFVGLVWVGSGVGTFFLYLRHYPAPSTEVE